LRLQFLDWIVFTANQPLQEGRILPMHRRDLLHTLCDLGFDYEKEQRHMGSRLACQERGFLPDSSPVSLQRISIHLGLKRKIDLSFFTNYITSPNFHLSLGLII